MEWGTNSEPSALEAYSKLMQGHDVRQRMFAVLRDDTAHDWLGASPDGIIDVASELEVQDERLQALCEGGPCVSHGCVHTHGSGLAAAHWLRGGSAGV